MFFCKWNRCSPDTSPGIFIPKNREENMEAKKTKTGKWTCCAYYKDADGIIRRPRFTADRKKDAERMAEACSLEHKDDYILAKRGKLPITFADAGKNYIKNRENVLSPSTLVGYQNMLNRAYEMIADQNIYDLTQEQVQSLVNLWTANGCSPKTVRNLHGLLTSVLKTYRPDFVLHTRLPQSVQKDLYTPTDQDIKILLAAIKDTRMEIPVLLAATGSLRRSEICALEAEDVGDGFVRIDKALVLNRDNKWVLKTTKTEAGTRVTYIPKEITDRIHQLVPEGRVVQMNPTMITLAFGRILRKAGLPPFRFHALRSYYASILHTLGVPDKYIMQWGGWHDERTLQTHYQKAMPDKVPDMAKIGIDHFQELL